MPPIAPIPIAAVLIAKNRRRDILLLIRVIISLQIFDAPRRLRADMCASADGPHKQTAVDFQNKLPADGIGAAAKIQDFGTYPADGSRTTLSGCRRARKRARCLFLALLGLREMSDLSRKAGQSGHLITLLLT
jgi:hypothetical protein